MFTIMESRKRPRLELINSINNDSNETLQGVATTATPTTSLGTATLATIGGQSFILSNSAASALPANILLSICDDNSDESEEYILDHAMLTTQIKQEHNVATQTINATQQPSTTLVTSNALPQYRLINPTAGKTLNSSNIIAAPSASSNSGLLTNSVHLPAGCEIYVIKEVIDNPPKQVLTADNSAASTTAAATKSPLNNNTTIKLEPMSPLPLIRHTTLTNSNNAQNLNSSQASTSFSPNTNNNNSSCSSAQDDNAKRSLILEAYKKRDDKRRATHNEVERRRRDKINSWIFKLKEMLPTDMTPSALAGNGLINKDNQNSSTTTTTRLLVQSSSSSPGANTTRSPPSDSKSQILIKACEYIKSMQDEIKSLRECLTENEHLRLSNQRLQQEINNLRHKQQQQHKILNNNNNILITTTNTNNLTNNHHHHNHDDVDDDEEDNSNECEITLNSLNSTYANVQLFSPTTATTMTTTTINQNNHHHQQHLAGLVGLTTNQNVTTTTPTNSATVNVTYAKRELIITDYVD